MDIFSTINYELIFTTSTIASLFFAIPIFVSMVVVRYATLAKLIRDSREDMIANKIHFKSIDDYKFHIFKYEKRLSLLKKALSSSLFSGILIIVSVVGVTFNYFLFGVIFFILGLFLIAVSMLLLIWELSVSFEALNEHLDYMKSLKIKIKR
ncbi:DUF2721 domain-containing protein [Alphaproteobacteria bacterium]|nr:DUF2721 domain-containing protein [Alphaproteobacteria bacterium]